MKWILFSVLSHRALCWLRIKTPVVATANHTCLLHVNEYPKCADLIATLLTAIWIVNTPPIDVMTSSILLIAWFNAFKPSCFSGVEVVITEKKNYSFLVSSAACFPNMTYSEWRTGCFLQLHDLFKKPLQWILTYTWKKTMLKLLQFNLCQLDLYLTCNSKLNLTHLNQWYITEKCVYATILGMCQSSVLRIRVKIKSQSWVKTLTCHHSSSMDHYVGW